MHRHAPGTGVAAIPRRQATMAKNIWILTLLAALAVAQEPASPGKPPPGEGIDLGKALRESEEFKKKCAAFEIGVKEGLVSAVGEIVYRGGGPCEYLVGVFPHKSHETVVLLDDGPWKGEGHRPLRHIEGLASVLNNAFLAAGFRRGKPFMWNPDTGEVKLPRGPAVHIYVSWKDGKGRTRRANMADWLWNYDRRAVMQRGKFVYTGSMIYDEGPPTHKKWLGAEVDGLIVAILTTSSSLVDHTEKGGLMNGAYEAIAARMPESGTRVKVLFSSRELEVTEKYPPLEVPRAEPESTRPADPPSGFGRGGKDGEPQTGAPDAEPEKEPGGDGEG
ncbi:MAG: YdjY domain-containing protein [Planctomycetota bacterium]